MSSIQLNLIPDVKAQYLKAERTRKTAIVVSVIIIAASAGLVLLMMSVSAGQKIALNSANKNIDKLAADIKNTQDIEKMLTVQSQLNTLDKLHSEKPVASRLPDFLAKIVPSQVQLNKIDVDLEQNTMTISGTTPSYEANNKFVDTLKFTNYQLAGSEDKTPAFNSVVLTSFGKDEKGASFTVTLNFDPVLFASSSDGIQLIPKAGVTTREQVPSALFTKPAEAKQ
jgi:hypothetical protein